MYYITPAPAQITDALESWRWIGIEGKQPWLVTAFADVFFDSPDGIWFLDTLEGKLKKVGETKAEVEHTLATEEGKDLYLFSGWVDRAIREGRILGNDECYDFRLHPIVGGQVDYSNVEKINLSVALHLRGQLHDQVRHMKPGTKISKFVLVDEQKVKPWWKLW